MNKLWISAPLALAFGLAACNTERAADDNVAETEAVPETEDGTTADAGTAGGATASTSWPAGSRIVVENGVTYRIEPGGARIALGPSDSRIVEEGDVRFRVDPDGTRVRINDEGAVIDVDRDGLDARVDLDGDTSVTVNSN